MTSPIARHQNGVDEADGALAQGDIAHERTMRPEPASPVLEPESSDSSFSVTVEKALHEEDEKEKEDDIGLMQRTTTGATSASEDATATRTTTRATQPDEGHAAWYKKLNPLRRGKVPPVPEERTVSPEYTASWWSVLTFTWMGPLMRLGYKRPLELNDIYLVNPNRSAELLSTRMYSSFKMRVARGDRYPLLWAMHETFRWEFWIGGMCRLSADIFQVISPFTLRYLINFATEAYNAQQDPSGPPGPNIGKGLGLVFGITLMQILQSLGSNHFMYRGMTMGGQARAVMIAVIFEKSMKLSGRAKAGGRDPEADQTLAEKGLGSKDDAEVTDGKKKKKEAKTGPKVTPNKSPSVAGDGAGWGNGRVVNLMSTDTYRVDQALGWFHIIWTAPVAMVITLILLLINLTYSALAGFAILIISTPILTKAIKSLFTRRAAINKITDERVSLTQEILQSVRFVKYFGWEGSFLQRLGDIRQREVHAIQVLLATRNAINAISSAMPIFASMLAFITFALTSHELNPAKIFSSLALFNSLRMPLNLLPLVIGQVIDAWASSGRIQEFLMAEESKDEIEWDYEGKNAIALTHADFTWERTIKAEDDKKKSGKKPGHDEKKKKQSKADKEAIKAAEKEKAASGSSSGMQTPTEEPTMVPFQLNDISFSVGRGELVAVIGNVGSGKSSLLAALAGDMRKTNGEIVMGATRAFCPQYAWIQNATVKENILFGKEYDPVWYAKVIEACALQPDLDMLPNGDQTEIGERGITVSGGQKQRLNIARAIYFNADIVLMDDPLSAVDAHVGRHIFDKAISGLLKDKCRILATHQLHIVNRCDRIVWMQDGRIEAIGTYPHLMANNKAFADMMVTTAVEETQEETVDGDEVDEEKKAMDKKKKKKSKSGPALMQAEERAVKSVPWSVYYAFITASGTILNGPLVVLLLILSQGANIATSLWLSWWTSNKWGLSMGAYIGIYAALGVAQAVLMFAFMLSLSIFVTNASKKMLSLAITRTLRAPMSFFDTTPLGRITNRFSKDVDTLDNALADAVRMYLLTLGMIWSVFILIIVYFYYFAIALGPLLVAFVLAAAFYRSSAREVKRHESVLRSVVFAQFSEALSGSACIRAYGLQQPFVKKILTSLDNMDSAYFITFSNQRWLSIRVDCIANLLVFTTGILVVTSRFNVSPSISGLVLSYILSIVMMFQFTVRQLAEVENGMNATERVHYYGTQLEEEAPAHLGDLPPTWPPHGEIKFDNVEMRYRENLPLVLQGLNMHVAGGERIGIVGRTGAGKSSIMSTLFRMVELSGGRITIDDVDISTIGLQDLRSRLAIIPQDPTLFRGTIRSNLDPFNEHTDLALWSALRQSDLVTDDPDSTGDATGNSTGRIQLDSIVEEEGLNFSLGQRQLMALARALVRGSQIIVCDEATSSVDMETDAKIQRTIMTRFRGKTLLCIAHRLRTIIAYDRICVMDAGKIVQLDTPLNLYDQGGIFRGMCEQSGIGREDFFEVIGEGVA
ncbi:MAG: hypothetical protein M4579_006126 [Chaenotheca gracillima]|nr:MAG: hypothetical protein M4579_006126 [Chaenotheca gracillima]